MGLTHLLCSQRMALEFGQPVIELNNSIIAGDEFCNLSDIRTNERDCAEPIVTANKVRTNLFVPGLFMKDLIFCNIDGTFVVTVEESGEGWRCRSW